MDSGLWIDAPSAAHATRLIDLLDGFDAKAVRNGHGHEVHIALDGASATLLIGLFDSLAGWLSDDDLGSCQIHFGERLYTLLQPSDGSPSDPRDFLLERTIQLQQALDSRVVIEQAKGVLAVLLDVELDEAFEALRKAARKSRRNIHDVSCEVVQLRTVPGAP